MTAAIRRGPGPVVSQLAGMLLDRVAGDVATIDPAPTANFADPELADPDLAQTGESPVNLPLDPPHRRRVRP